MSDPARHNQYHRREYPSGVSYHPMPTRQDPSLTEVGHMFVADEVDDEWRAMMEDRPTLAFDENPQIWEYVASVLNETELAVVEMVVVRQLSLREAGELLAHERGRDKPYGKPWMQKVRDRAMDKLREAFLGNE